MTGTTSRSSTQTPPLVIGHDRDVDEVADRLAGEGSVIIVGPLGSGKSYFGRAIVEALRMRGIAPVVVRAAVPLRAIPFGALDAAGDPRLDGLRVEAESAPRTPHTASFVLVVDDAHALDPESIEVISRAIYTRRARVLLSVTADPLGAHVITTPQAITDLWLQGGVERYDLHPLDTDEAEELISAYGGGALDTVTRAVLITRAAGSRMILRELTTDALDEFAAGRDPLDPDRQEQPGSRLSAAIETMVSDYTPEEQLALAVIGRCRGIGFATACRSIESTVIETLIARRSLHTDDAPAPSLFANPLLARTAERGLAPERLDRALDEIVARALTSPGAPVGRGLDSLIATLWLSGRPSVPGPDEVDDAERLRILTSAARNANATGRADLALAFVDLAGDHGESAELCIEASRATARLGRFAAARELIERLTPAALSPSDLRRLVRWAGLLGTWERGEGAIEQVGSWLSNEGVSDPSVLLEVEGWRTIQSGLQLEWAEAARSATAILVSPGSAANSRETAALVSGVAFAELGRADDSRATFAEAARMNRDPITGRVISVAREVLHLAVEAFAAALADPGGPLPVPAPERVDRLQTAIRLMAERDEREALGLAGLAAGNVLGEQRDDAGAAREFTAALRRFESVEFAAWRPLVICFQAGSFARLGRVAEARASLAAVDGRGFTGYRLMRFVRAATEAELAAASGDSAAAESAARASIELRSHAAAGERLPHFDVVHLQRILRLAAASTAIHSEDEGSLDGDTTAFAHLTDREHEVALLVARRLSNKEIAQHLFLSVRTVESHIYSARGKLGARSRRELGRLVAENDTFRP